MSQLTLYLDTETEAKMRQGAREAGVSLSRWVADLIREKTADEWPESISQLAGAWPDFPTREEIHASLGEDLPREGL
ncbi:MAG: CopG family transcriptional regulator [bacterium]|nr:CopG family transcriptional regulator [bacterium]